jgi:hypothetical protein
MAASTIIKNLNDGTITLSDGTGSPVTLVVPFSVGDLTISDLKQKQNETARYETRGVFNVARHTSRIYASGSFSFMIADYSDATNQTVLDFVRKQNSFSANVSKYGANADVYAIDIILTVEGTNHGDPSDHTLTIPYSECVMTLSEGDPNQGTISFTTTATAAEIAAV